MLAGLLFVQAPGWAQNLSNKGKEFWVGYGHHQFMEPGQPNSQEMVLYFSAEQTAQVTVTVKGRSAIQTTNYTVPAGTVIASNYMPKAGSFDCRLYDVPPSFGGNGGEGLFNLSIHIQSDVPIVAYAHTFGSASSGATMLMPVETFGYSYISINSRQVYQPNCFSWAYVIASHDNTVVEITPSVQTRLNRPAGTPFQVTLNKGQIYQVIGANPSNSSTSLEVSGTKFKSIANSSGDCYPIAVFSGSSRTSNPISCGSGGGDNDNQQLFPMEAWGKRYLTAPTSRSNAANQFMTNSYRVVVKDPATVVRRNGTVLTGLQQNSFYFFESTTADLIEADKPIMVAQFMTGGNCLGGSGLMGDPEMIYISPVEQGIKRVGFYRNTREAIQVNYLTLIIPNNGLPSLRIDGSPTFDHSYPHPQLSGYTVVVKRWTAAQAQAIVYSDSAFTAITYGLGSVESYGYNAGTMINNLSAQSSLQNTPDPTVPVHAYTCVGTPVNLSVLMAYQPTRFDVLLSALGASVTPNLDVTVSNPASLYAGTTTVNGIPYYKYTLPGTYTFLQADTFDIPVKGYHPSIENCYNRENLSIAVIVKEKPVANFSFVSSGCTADPVSFTGQGTTSNGYTITSFNWNFGGGLTGSGQNVLQTLAPGTHTVQLSVVSDGGCADDTTRTITIYDRPPAQFQTNPLQVCVGTPIAITDTSSATVSITEWWWDFGNGVIQTSTTSPTINYTYPAPGTYTIKHVSKASATCISDTVLRTVTIYALPVLSFTHSAAGCLAPNGIVDFTGTATTPDGQTFASYLWNFGDANATTGNPNTATTLNSQHSYQAGNFTVNLSATTSNGCSNTISQNIVVNLKPSFTFTPLTALCENASPVSVAFATVTNGVTGTGIYYGPGTNAAGQFDPAVAGPGLHTIWYKLTSAAGCVDSVSQTIRVHPKPVADFSLGGSGNVCVGQNLSITPSSSIATGTITQWSWNLGNGTTPIYTNGSSFTTSYTTAGSVSITLVNTSDQGCVSAVTTRTVEVRPLPVANFTLPVGICMPGGSSLFTNTSSIADNSTLSWQWNFGDGNTSVQQNPSHIFTSVGVYNVTLVATSPYGCSHQKMAVMNGFVASPIASFSVNPQELCQGADNTFQDNSTPGGAAISNWSWDFADGSTSISANPVKRYTQPGTYTVRLVVTNQAGCVSTPFTLPVTVHLQPVIDAGSSYVVQEGTPITLNATANDPTLVFSWTPPIGFNNPSVLNPILTAVSDQVYTLTATGNFGCRSTDTMSVKILKLVKVPNIFTPNGDQIHDRWVIPNLEDYPGATVQIFNRYGQQVFSSNGYGVAWDGTQQGKPLPVGTYYYIIQLKNGYKPLSGSVTLLR